MAQQVFGVKDQFTNIEGEIELADIQNQPSQTANTAAAKFLKLTIIPANAFREKINRMFESLKWFPLSKELVALPMNQSRGVEVWKALGES